MGKGSGICDRPALSFLGNAAESSSNSELWIQEQQFLADKFASGSKLVWQEDWHKLYLQALETAAYRNRPTWKLSLYGMEHKQIEYIKKTLQDMKERAFDKEDYWEDSYALVKDKEDYWKDVQPLPVLDKEFFITANLVDEQQIKYINEAIEWLKNEAEEEKTFIQSLETDLYQPPTADYLNNSILEEGRISWLNNYQHRLDVVKACTLNLTEQQRKKVLDIVEQNDFVDDIDENRKYYLEWNKHLIDLIDKPIMSLNQDPHSLAEIIAKEHFEECPYEDTPETNKRIFDVCLQILNSGTITAEDKYYTLGEKLGEAKILESHMQINDENCKKFEKRLLSLKARNIIEPTPYPYYQTENILQANQALSLQKDEMELTFIPNSLSQPIESSKGSLMVKGGTKTSQLQWLKELEVGEGLITDAPTHSYNDELKHSSLKLPEQACLLHYVTGTDSSNQSLDRFKMIVEGGGLLSSRERAKRNMLVKSLSPIGDAISGIDDGVSTSIKYKDNICHGGSINIVINPKVLARKKIQFSPTDWGAGDRKHKFKNYKNKIKQTDKYPSLKVRENHYQNLQEHDNECYVDKHISVNEFEALVVDANIYHQTKDFVRQKQKLGILPPHLKVRPVPCEVDGNSAFDGYVNLENIPKGLPLLFRDYSAGVHHVAQQI